MTANNAKNLSWDKDMEELLLELRMNTFAQNFMDSSNRKDIQKGWELVRARFIDQDAALAQSVTVPKLKNKYQLLKTLFQKHYANEQRTGNAPMEDKPGTSNLFRKLGHFALPFSWPARFGFG